MCAATLAHCPYEPSSTGFVVFEARRAPPGVGTPPLHPCWGKFSAMSVGEQGDACDTLMCRPETGRQHVQGAAGDKTAKSGRGQIWAGNGKRRIPWENLESRKGVTVRGVQ